jgi:predicted ArsR family transcriptional regulator
MAATRRNRNDIRTRRAIMDLLKREGAQSAQQLATALGVSAMAVRQHLYALENQKMVAFTEVPRPRGRPEKQWQLTDGAASFFPDGHADLTVDLIGAMGEAFGSQGLKKLLTVRAQQQLQHYQSHLSRYKSLSRRLKRLAALRTEEGYMAEVLTEPDGTLLFVENHCPICTAAASCTGLCGSELEVFQGVLGDLAEVERCEHILNGDRRCVYRIQSKTPPGQARYRDVKNPNNT